MSSVSASSNTQGAEILTASLSKKQQNQEGEMALALIQSVANSSPAQSTIQSPTASMGNYINIKT